MKSGAKSLWIQLGLALVASSLVAIAVASVILYVRFKATNSTFSEHTLRNETHIIGKYLRRVQDDAPLNLPPLSWRPSRKPAANTQSLTKMGRCSLPVPA
jgi:hypothetical protein